MPFQPLNLYKTRNEEILGESKEVELKAKTGKAKVYTYYAYNRPVIGYIIDTALATIYLNNRHNQFIYAKIGSTFCWVSLELVDIVGAKVERNEFGGYRFIWGDTGEKETIQEEPKKSSKPRKAGTGRTGKRQAPNKIIFA